VLRGAWIARARTDDGEWTEVRTDLIVWSLLPEDLEGVGDQLPGGFTSFGDWN
jgi:hypothetical protein